MDRRDSQFEIVPVGVSDRGVLNQLVNLNCVPLVPDGDAKRQGLYWFRQSMPYVQSERSILYSLHRSASSRGVQAQGERELVPGLGKVSCGLLETLLSGGWDVYVCELPGVLPISPPLAPPSYP